jgi:hypothetical protein
VGAFGSRATSRYCSFVSQDGGACWAIEVVDDPWQARAECEATELCPLEACRCVPCSRCGVDAYLVRHDEVDPAAWDRDRFLAHESKLCPGCGHRERT